MVSIVSHVKSTLYPDNYLSIGFATNTGKIKAKEKEYEKRYENQFDCYDTVDYSYRGTTRTSHRFFVGGAEATYKLDRCSKLSQPKKRYGTHGISSAGKRKLRAGSALLQKLYGKKRLGFGTLTLPNFPPAKIKYLAENWGRVTRVFYQRLKRLFIRKQAPVHILGCTEIQPKRYKSKGEIAPHLHFVYVAKPSTGTYYVTKREVREAWNSVILSILKKGFPITGKPAYLFASCKLQPIKKDVGRYLGKYLSKGGEIIDQINEDGREQELPRQWWTMTSEMKDIYQESLETITPALAMAMFMNPESFVEAGVLKYYSMVSVEILGEMKTVGMVAYLTDDSYRAGLVCPK